MIFMSMFSTKWPRIPDFSHPTRSSLIELVWSWAAAWQPLGNNQALSRTSTFKFSPQPLLVTPPNFITFLHRNPWVLRKQVEWPRCTTCSKVKGSSFFKNSWCCPGKYWYVYGFPWFSHVFPICFERFSAQIPCFPWWPSNSACGKALRAAQQAAKLSSE